MIQPPREAATADPTPPEPMSGLAGGNNRATTNLTAGWVGTVHDLTSAEKARNFRASLDRQRAAAHPEAAAVGASIVDATFNNLNQFGITPPKRLKPKDRTGEYEQRITQLEGMVAELMDALRESQGPLRNVFLATQHGTATAEWQENTAQGSNIVTFQDGRSCLSSTNAGQILAPGSSGAFALLEIRDGTNTAYFKLGGGIDILQNTTNVATLSPFLNMSSTRGTFNILEFFSDTVGGRNGASLRFKDPVNQYAGIYYDGTNFIFDYLRARP